MGIHINYIMKFNIQTVIKLILTLFLYTNIWSAIPLLRDIKLQVTIKTNRPDSGYRDTIYKLIQDNLRTNVPEIVLSENSEYILSFDIDELNDEKLLYTYVHIVMDVRKYLFNETGTVIEIYWQEKVHNAIRTKDYNKYLENCLYKLVKRFKKEWYIENKLKRNK